MKRWLRKTVLCVHRLVTRCALSVRGDGHPKQAVANPNRIVLDIETPSRVVRLDDSLKPPALNRAD